MKTTNDEPDNPTSNSQKELISILVEVAQKNRRIAGESQKLAANAHNTADVADAMREVAHVVKLPPNSESVIRDWNLENQQADFVIGQLDRIDIAPVYSTSGTAIAGSSDAFTVEALIQYVPKNDHEFFYSAMEDFEQVTSRAADENQVVELIRSLDLNIHLAGRKSPLNLFSTAHAAYKNPVIEGNPVSTSLIPMRESVRLIIDILLRRRPKQEKTKNEQAKIISIGTQLKYETLPTEIISSWANQWTNILKSKLSPSKEEEISRDEWRRRLISATLFLKGFISGIDPSKFKK